MIDLMKWLANGVTAHPPPPSFSGPQLRRNPSHIFIGEERKKAVSKIILINCMSDDDDDGFCLKNAKENTERQK